MDELLNDELVPGLDPRPVTMAEYHAYAPERVELLGGYVFEPAEARRRALRLLLVNTGLLEAVKLVPAERWREAIQQVYGSG